MKKVSVAYYFQETGCRRLGHSGEAHYTFAYSLDCIVLDRDIV